VRGEPRQLTTIESDRKGLRWKFNDRTLSVPVDGKDHVVPGESYTIAWERPDERTWIQRQTRGGVVTTSTRRLSADGKNFEVEFTLPNRPLGSQHFVRVSGSPARKDRFVGTWEQDLSRGSGFGSGSIRFDCEGGTLKYYNAQAKLVWESKLDGKPHVNAATSTAYELTRVDENTIKEINTVTGMPPQNWLFKVSPDGKTMMHSYNVSPERRLVRTYERTR
jgi:hypothetical protein